MLDVTRVSPRLPAASLAALVRSVAAAALARTRIEALSEIATAARSVTGSDVTLLRIPTADGDELEAAAVAGSAPLAAELAGTRVSVAELPAGALSDLALAPAATRRAAELARAPELCLVVAGEARVSLELLRAGDPFSPEERVAAELCAAHALLVLRAFGGGEPTEALARPALELVGEALAAARARAREHARAARAHRPSDRGAFGRAHARDRGRARVRDRRRRPRRRPPSFQRRDTRGGGRPRRSETERAARGAAARARARP